MHQRVEQLAITDPLTGIYNRRYFERELRSELERARRYGWPVSILVLDIDRFKLFNDTYGHETGDEVIRRVAQAIVTSCRRVDIVGRCGGDEFAVVLPQTDDRSVAIVAKRILSALEKEAFQAPDGTKVPISTSIGAASYPSDIDESDQLFSLADAAMYRAKAAGGGQFASPIVESAAEILRGGS